MASALVLFDIDGTLLRRSGPAHREALERAVREVLGLRATTDGIPVVGMLDRDILTRMMLAEGASPATARRHLPAVMKRAQSIYVRLCPDLRRRVCPGVRSILHRLDRRGIPMGLVTGNLSRIGWTKMERAGLRPRFRLGAFAEEGPTRTELARRAAAAARRAGWLERNGTVALVGDHFNDIDAARANGFRAVSVATGLISRQDLAAHRPDVLVEDMRGLTLEMLIGR
jgi:phosphoglycolate phosphatase-like HAD superfamily hydrolase